MATIVWTYEMRRRLLSLINQHASLRRICDELQQDESSVRRQCSRLGVTVIGHAKPLSAPVREIVLCLKCHQPFMSRDKKKNRICEPCKKSNGELRFSFDMHRQPSIHP